MKQIIKSILNIKHGSDFVDRKNCCSKCSTFFKIYIYFFYYMCFLNVSENCDIWHIFLIFKHFCHIFFSDVGDVFFKWNISRHKNSLFNSHCKFSFFEKWKVGHFEVEHFDASTLCFFCTWIFLNFNREICLDEIARGMFWALLHAMFAIFLIFKGFLYFSDVWHFV